MALGTSLFLITILLLGVFGIRVITKRKAWGKVAKIMAGLVFLIILIVVAIWGWSHYKNRPRPIDTLGSLSLGMTPVEVTLAVGEPTHELAPGEIDNSRRYIYTDYSGEVDYFIRFSDKSENGIEQIAIICSSDYARKIFGLGKYSKEEQVLNKLGTPSDQSIRQDGLRKMISYKMWGVAFEIEKKSVVSVCISSSGKVRYLEEFGSAQGI